MNESNISVEVIKKRLTSSFVILTSRQIALNALGFVTIDIILARVLSVETLGIFNIANTILMFFSFFSDIGLGASLIQKKEGITSEDIKTTFTIQEILVACISLVVILSAPLFGEFYKLNEGGVWLVRALGFGFFISSLRVIPSVLLERNLKFGPLVTTELLETLSFNIILLILVFLKYDVWSFAIATVVSRGVGVVGIYVLAPIRLSFGIYKKSIRNLFAFGVPYQINSILAMLKDQLVPLVVAHIIGPIGVGYVTWSQALAFLPLQVMNNIIRVTFPAFSRLQHDKNILERLVEESLFITAILTYPALFGLAAILPAVVHFVVSPKWQPAVLSFYLFCFSTYWAVISTTFTNTLNAIGQIKSTLKLMIMWTVSTWVLTPVLVYFYGYNGVGLSSFIISFTSIFTIIAIKKHLSLKVFNAVFLPTLLSMLMAIVVFEVSNIFVRNYLSLFLVVVLGALIYACLIYLLARKRIIDSLKFLKHE